MSNNIFQKILNTRSLTVMDYKCEDALDTDASLTAEDKSALRTILNTNNLDERWALAHEHLGEHAEAKVLREWLAAAAARKRKDSDLLTGNLVY